MKAFLLSAGLGTRLRPLTETTPKCMVPIRGRPMLDLWLDALARAGVDEVLINLHHLAGVVQRHLQTRVGPPLTRTTYEPELLGSAGTLMANREWVAREDVVLACNVDNLTNFDLRRLIEAHRRSGSIATLTLFHAERPSSCGIVEVDGNGRLVGYAEKPPRPSSDLANAGMYAFHPSLIDEIVGPPPKDIGYDVLPHLVGRAHTIAISDFFMDIGTVNAYESAQREWHSVESSA